MEPIKLDGKAVADEICRNLKYRVDMLNARGFNPKLTIVTSGEDSASQMYVKNKVRRAEEIGIGVNVWHFDNFGSSALAEVCFRTHNPMIIQEPITGSVKHEDVSHCIESQYDADCFSYDNVGRLVTGTKPFFYPCTPRGIIHLLDCYDIPLEGKNVCIIGRSNIVGRPLSWMMEQKGATVTLCHSKTDEKTIYNGIRDSDIVVSAVGKPEFIKRLRGDIVAKYSIQWNEKVFVDVGINRDKEGHLCGDFHPNVYEESYAYTPVPGGVGPMTVAMLMLNVVEHYERMARDAKVECEG